MASDKSPDPCMPTPIMPKRTRSLAGTVFRPGVRSSGIGPNVFVASDAPAATALVPRNSRREYWLLVTASPPFRVRRVGQASRRAGPKVPCDRGSDKARGAGGSSAGGRGLLQRKGDVARGGLRPRLAAARGNHHELP